MLGGAEIAGALLEVLIFSGTAPRRPVEVLACDRTGSPGERDDRPDNNAGTLFPRCIFAEE